AAIERCRSLGMCAATIGNVQHLGRIGAFGEMAVEAGLISLHFVSVNDHGGLAAPHGGRDARFGTNPVCIAVPGFERMPPFLLDFATTKIALGKVRVAMMKGETLSPGQLLDGQGRPTTDPSVMYSDPMGALLTMGEHKGYGLAFACEILSGVLAGFGTIQPEHKRLGGIGNAMLAIVLDPARFGKVEDIAKEIKATTDHFLASPPAEETGPPKVPGDPERETMRARLANGIDIEAATWAEIVKEAKALGVDAPRASP
ncbi:MAG: Ldh family oxidoreductase, partial [Pseudomonadota bacterium]